MLFLYIYEDLPIYGLSFR